MSLMNDSQYTTRLKERESFEIIYFYGLLPIEQSNLHEPFFSLSLSDAVSSNSENGISLDYVIPESLFFLLLCMHVYDLSSSCSSLLHPIAHQRLNSIFFPELREEKKGIEWERFSFCCCCAVDWKHEINENLCCSKKCM